MAKEEAHLKPFEEVKDQIAQERKRQQVIDTMQKLADEAHAELAKNPQQAEQIAAKLGIDLVRAQNVAAGNPLPDIGVSAELEEAYGLAKGGVSPVVQIAPTKLAVATVTDVIPARPAELAEVEGQIRSQLTETAVNTLLDQKAGQAADQARACGRPECHSEVARRRSEDAARVRAERRCRGYRLGRGAGRSLREAGRRSAWTAPHRGTAFHHQGGQERLPPT